MADLDEGARETGRLRLSEGIVYGVTAALSAALAFVRTPLYTHWFPPDAYGDFVLITTSAELLRTVILAVFSNVLYRYYDQQRRAGDLDTLVSTVVIGTGGALLLVGVAGAAAGYLLGTGFQGVTLAWFLALTIIVTLQGLISQVNRMEHQAAAFAVAKLIDPIWKLGMPFVFFAFGVGGLPALAGVAAVSGTGSLLLAGRWAWPVLRQTRLSRVTAEALGAALAYGLPLAPWAVAAWVIGSSNRYVINHFLGPEATGVFSMGYNLASMPITLFSSVLVLTVGPVVWERLNVHGRKQAFRLIRVTSGFFLAIALPGALALGVLADRIVGLLFSAEYAGAWIVMLPAALGAVFSGLYSFLVKPRETHMETRAVPFYVGAGAVANFLISLEFVPRIGIVGAAWGSLVGYAVVAVIMAVDARGRYGVDLLPGWRDLVPIGGGCAVMGVSIAVLGSLTKWSEPVVLGLMVVLGGTIYFLALTIMGWALKSELMEAIREAFRRVPMGVAGKFSYRAKR